MSGPEIALTVVVAVMALVSVVLVVQQMAREERTRAECEKLRRENNKLMLGAGRLINQVEDLDGVPVWRPPNGDTTMQYEDATLHAMQTMFTKEELELLSADAGLEYEHVGGQSLLVIALRLRERARHLGMDERLKAAIRRVRPNAKL